MGFCVPLSLEGIAVVCIGQPESKERVFVYLAYVDDSGTKQKYRNFQVLSAVLIHDRLFSNIECLIGTTVEEVVPPEKLESFVEFHGCELFGGYGIFEGIEDGKRHHAITRLLTLLRDYKLPVISAAVNVPLLKTKVYASANPIDIAFRHCLKGIDEWIGTGRQKQQEETGLVIVDDTTDKEIKSAMQESFRQLRKPIRPPHWTPGALWYLHDDLYFGSSKYSVGIQLADLCSFFIAKHLEGQSNGEEFYGLIHNEIAFSKIEPESS